MTPQTGATERKTSPNSNHDQDEELDLSWLTIKDTFYLSVFDDIWWSSNPGSLEWLETKPFDSRSAKKLSKESKVDYPLAAALMQLAKLNQPEGLSPKEVREYKEDYIAMFIYQASMYEKTKQLIDGEDRTIKIAVHAFVNSTPFEIYQFSYNAYRKKIVRNSVIFSLITLLVLLLELIYNQWALLIVTSIVAVIASSWLWTMVSKKYKALRKLSVHLQKHSDIDLETSDPIPAEDMDEYIVHFYDETVYKADQDSIEAAHLIKVPARLIKKMSKEYGFSHEVAKDMLQHYGQRHSSNFGVNFSIAEPYYEYYERFYVALEGGFKGAFVNEWKREWGKGRQQRPLWKLYLYSACGLGAMTGGIVAVFWGMDGKHGTNEKIQGTVFFVIGMTYLYVYGAQIYYRHKNKRVKP